MSVAVTRLSSSSSQLLASYSNFWLPLLLYLIVKLLFFVKFLLSLKLETFVLKILFNRTVLLLRNIYKRNNFSELNYILKNGTRVLSATRKLTLANIFFPLCVQPRNHPFCFVLYIYSYHVSQI